MPEALLRYRGKSNLLSFMKTMKKQQFTCVLSLAFALSLATTQAVPITITDDNLNTGVDNVLFQTDQTDVLTAYGHTSGFQVAFTSDSGSKKLDAKGGQAEIWGGTGNDPLIDLSFWLPGMVFTKAVVNPFAVYDGKITFKVDYINPLGQYQATFDVDGNGQNYFTILADAGYYITKVNFFDSGSYTETKDQGQTVQTPAPDGFDQIKQVRIGGIQQYPKVPDVGFTLSLLGLSFLSLGALRRKLS